MTRPAEHPPAANVRLTTAQVAASLTALARVLHDHGDPFGVVLIRDVRVWLNGTVAQARAAERRQLVRCPHCHDPLPEVGELHDLLHQLAVEL